MTSPPHDMLSAKRKRGRADSVPRLRFALGVREKRRDAASTTAQPQSDHRRQNSREKTPITKNPIVSAAKNRSATDRQRSCSPIRVYPCDPWHFFATDFADQRGCLFTTSAARWRLRISFSRLVASLQ